jgi:hypothetical protein
MGQDSNLQRFYVTALQAARFTNLHTHTEEDLFISPTADPPSTV